MDNLPGEVGQLIGGRYELRELIGRGGMGCVWRAQHLALGTPLAIKLLTPTSCSREEAHARFIREAKAAAALKSRNVVQVLDHGVDGDIPYIAMELLEGETLSTCLQRERCLTAGATATVMKGVLRAVARAHRAAVIHRDLKPDNIFLVRDGDDPNELVVKVLDFGIAKVLEEQKGQDVSTRTGAMLGTPFYMSPEQSRGVRDLDGLCVRSPRHRAACQSNSTCQRGEANSVLRLATFHGQSRSSACMTSTLCGACVAEATGIYRSDPGRDCRTRHPRVARVTRRQSRGFEGDSESAMGRRCARDRRGLAKGASRTMRGA